MSLSHLFSCVNEDGVFKVFRDLVLKSIVCVIYAGAKHVMQKEILIGLQWHPEEKEVPPQLWAYIGMLAIHCANFITTGIARDIGPEDQQNFNTL
ncbi:hypothetical protein PILCRDRAFT_14269 [Piloderma croceum F 1598]|uniref:Uncharacterized protein n=1 Tax=Piloderma croceum (strain F 1598) TaxID=765440 RepID=A0A0C3F3M5_PILCF|nr:hypothetical protein PILCRDRAFT_14269 [Piloderma croceum F 1598]